MLARVVGSLSRMLRPVITVLLFSSATTAACAAVTSNDPTSTLLGSDTTLSREGYFVLSWDAPAAQAEPQAILQQSTDATFASARERRVTTSGSLTVSGMEDGDYWFRVGSPGNWSEPLLVTVSHHPLSRALGFFGVGLLLFCVLVFVILRGNRAAGT